ncbi:MAG: hypothetical protein WD607_05890 [Candidatus Paceibacterota bacterium]
MNAPFLNSNQIFELSIYAFLSDKEIRSDLVTGFIKDENDYTSNFTGAFRRNINSYSKTGLNATSFMLPNQGEQETGCDATIIISNSIEAKIILFEAKWPRLSKSNSRWDYKQTASGLSHFSDQLDRQKNFNNLFAIFEIIYCEYPFFSEPNYMQPHGSSCIWHENALDFKNKRKTPNAIWNKNDMINLLKTGNNPIYEIMKDICECKYGDLIRMNKPEEIIEEFRLEGNVLAIEANNDLPES